MIGKSGEEITKIYLKYYNLFRARDLWQAHYQLFSIISLAASVELNVNKNMMTKKCRIFQN